MYRLLRTYATIPTMRTLKGARVVYPPLYVKITMNERNQGILATLIEKWHDLQVVGKLFMDPHVPIFYKLIPVVALLYFISPIDVIPDVLIGPGQLDDAAVILFALSLFLRLVPQERVEIARATMGYRREDEVEVKVEREE